MFATWIIDSVATVQIRAANGSERSESHHPPRGGHDNEGLHLGPQRAGSSRTAPIDTIVVEGWRGRFVELPAMRATRRPRPRRIGFRDKVLEAGKLTK
jgi:hypothetical protein